MLDQAIVHNHLPRNSIQSYTDVQLYPLTPVNNRLVPEFKVLSASRAPCSSRGLGLSEQFYFTSTGKCDGNENSVWGSCHSNSHLPWPHFPIHVVAVWARGNSSPDMASV